MCKNIGVENEKKIVYWILINLKLVLILELVEFTC
jgi:hypothetical protein